MLMGPARAERSVIEPVPTKGETVPDSMQAIRITPEAQGCLSITEVEPPTPAANEALIRVRAFSLNRGEVRHALGAHSGGAIGWDLVGVVENPALECSCPAKGERVVAFSKAARGWSELAAIPTTDLAVIPDGVSDEDAATLPVAGLTALYCLERGQRLLGSPVLITGASGGVGLYACRLARLMGARVVAQVRSAAHEGLVRSAGADQVVVDESGEKAESLGPYRLIVDGIGGEFVGTLFPMLARDGVAVIYGVSAAGEARLQLRPLMFTGRGQIQGFNLFRESEVEAAQFGLERLLYLLQSKALSCHISVRDDWRKVGAVAEDLLMRKFVGKAVLTVST